MHGKRLASAVTSVLSVACAVLAIWSCTSAEPSSKKAPAAGEDSAATVEPAVQPAAAAVLPDTVVQQDSTAPTPERRLIVYYFRTTYRCPSCIYIERHTQAAVKEVFARELQSGRVVLTTINVEDPGNEHFVEDYKLYTKSVVLSDVTRGTQKRWKNLEKVWQLMRDDADFRDYIVKEVKAFLGA